MDVFDALKGLPYVGKNNEILSQGTTAAGGEETGEEGPLPEAPAASGEGQQGGKPSPPPAQVLLAALFSSLLGYI